MAIIRVTKEQLDKANKAYEAALLADPEFRLHEELLQRISREVTIRREGEQPS